MKALNFEGQILINDSKVRGMFDRAIAVNFIKKGMAAIKDSKDDEARKYVYKAYELIGDSCRAAFIVVRGLKPLVINEASDARNHNWLSEIESSLYAVYCELHRLDNREILGGNVINFRAFQVCKIMKKLASIVCRLIDYASVNAEA